MAHRVADFFIETMEVIPKGEVSAVKQQMEKLKQFAACSYASATVSTDAA